MGEVPEWYPLIVAARYLEVPPWELWERPTAWRDMALASMKAEHRASEQRRR